MDCLKPADPNRTPTASEPAVKVTDAKPVALPVRLTYLLEPPTGYGEVLRVMLAE
jgi:hypothetical protein